MVATAVKVRVEISGELSQFFQGFNDNTIYRLPKNYKVKCGKFDDDWRNVKNVQNSNIRLLSELRAVSQSDCCYYLRIEMFTIITRISPDLSVSLEMKNEGFVGLRFKILENNTSVENNDVAKCQALSLIEEMSDVLFKNYSSCHFKQMKGLKGE